MRGARHSRGFTLIEIIVVVFIIGLVATATVLSFTGQKHDDELVKEAERLDALFDYVREQAELQTRDYGLRIDRKGYSFVVFDVIADQWRKADEDDALRDRKFPDGIEPTAVVDGRTIVLETPKESDSNSKKVVDLTPQVMVFANGDLSSFEVGLERSQQRARIYTDEQTNIKLLRPGETEESAAAARTASK
ncbi:MAG: type II secretion system minor pseudopilin GspH [Nocardioides sp.]